MARLSCHSRDYLLALTFDWFAFIPGEISGSFTVI
jgi:hypothetical protein